MCIYLDLGMPLQIWGVHLSVSCLFAFSDCSWGFKARILKWFAISFSSGPRFVRPTHLRLPYIAWLVVSVS